MSRAGFFINSRPQFLHFDLLKADELKNFPFGNDSDQLDALEYAIMSTHKSGKTLCPHCKMGVWRQDIGIEFHSIGTLLRRKAGDDRDFQKLLDESKFTERFNTFVMSHGFEPVWRTQLFWIADSMRRFRNETSPKRYKEHLASYEIMKIIHSELRVDGSVHELNQWACQGANFPYPRGKRQTTDGCDKCRFNHPGDFTKWESIEQIHVLPDMGEQETQIRFAAMRTFIEHGYEAMIDQHWYAMDYLAEIGRHDWKMLMTTKGNRVEFTSIADVREDGHLVDSSIARIDYGKLQFKSQYIQEHIFNSNWFMGIPPGRMVLIRGKASKKMTLFIFKFHIAAKNSFILPDTRAKENGIFDYFDSVDS